METAQENILVVYELPPHLKHATIFGKFDEMKPGETLTIHNDHDPKPLFYQLQATRGAIFDWEYLEQGPDLWRIRITKTGRSIEVLNATLLEPRVKHQTIFQKFDSLEPGESFVLYNDHDPRPLYFQLLELRGEIFSWEYIERGPYEFRILITKNAETNQSAQQEDEAAGDVNVINVPSLEPRLKHPTIFKKFEELKPGEKLTIHNDHDPKPLYYQLLDQHGDIFTWQYLEQGPSRWRILVTKKETGIGEETLGEIVTKDLRKAEVFNKFGIDFCCGGKKTLSEACAEKGINVAVVARELKEADKLQSSARPLPYNDWSLDFLADYIVNTHHSYVRKSIPDLKAYADKVARVHGGRHPELLEINRLVQETMAEMLEHSDEEENVLFPYIKRLVRERKDGENVKGQIDLRVQEHELVGGNMDKIREISNNYALPDDACASYSFLFKSLDEFEHDLHIHVHLENNILFPKAIELEKEIIG